MNSEHRQPERGDSAREAESDIGKLFGSSITRMVSHYQSALHHGLDKEIEKVVNDFERATVGSNESVAKRMRSRIEELVSEEVRRVLDNTLYNAERSFTDPVRELAAEMNGTKIPTGGTDERRRRKVRNRDERPAARDHNPPISGSVPQGYPQTQQGTPSWAAEDQEAPMAGNTSGPVFGQREPAGGEADHTSGPTPVSPASWVLPGGEPLVDEPPQHGVSNEEPSQPQFSAPEIYFEPDDEVDPFVASLDDDLVPESDYFPDDESYQEDTSELPDDAITAVMSENTDFTTIAHDSKEIVHVPSSYEQPYEDGESDDEYTEDTFAGSEDEELDVETGPMDVDLSFAETSEEPEELEGDARADSFQALPEPSTDEEEDASSEAESLEEVDERAERMPMAVIDVHEDPSAGDDADEEEQSDVEPVTEPTAVDGIPDAQDAAEVAPEFVPEVAPEIEKDPVAELITPANDVSESTETQETPESAATEARKEPSAQALPGSVEIDNDQAEGDEIPEEATFEGTVRLNVEARGCIKEIVHFVRELRQKPELRLLRLVGNNKEGVDIWLGLREPLRIKTMLPEIEGVNISVRPLPHVGGQDEKLLGVRMTRLVAAEAVSEVS